MSESTPSGVDSQTSRKVKGLRGRYKAYRTAVGGGFVISPDRETAETAVRLANLPITDKNPEAFRYVPEGATFYDAHIPQYRWDTDESGEPIKVALWEGEE